MNRPQRYSVATVVALATALPVCAQESTDGVRGWLDRMNTASEQLNYQGTYVHAVDGNAEEFHIVHGFVNGAVREKITAGGAEGREILWNEASVWTIFPDQRLVLARETDRASLPVVAALNYTDELEQYYHMTTFPRGSVANRETQIVSVRARDQFRYGYLFWLDRETALPLRMQVRDDDGRVIESLIFTDIELVDSFPESAFESSVSTDGFTWKRPGQPEGEETSNQLWGATRLPTGFRLSTSRASMMAGYEQPVQHLVYTDGLASVSVFIANPESGADVPEGFSRDGSRNAYSLRVNGRWATAIGEVPGRTVQSIATSLDAR